MIINELGGSPIRSDNVYFAKNEQASLVFFIAHAEQNLIKLNQRILLTVFRRVLCEIQANQLNFLTFEN